MSRSILIVDDDPSILRFLNLHLHRVGYEVFEARGAIEAMDVLWKQTVDLVITDMRMPQIDGFDIVASLKQKHPKLPIVVVSADPRNLRVEHVLRYSGVTFVPKPFEIEALLQIVARQLPESSERK